MYQIIEKLIIIIELQEGLIKELCKQVSQNAAIDSELRKIAALKAEIEEAPCYKKLDQTL